MNSDVSIEIDFLADWILGIKRTLESEGYNLDATPEKEEIIINYFNLRKRMISAIPRKVIFSKEFSCPEDKKEGLDLIIRKATNGEDLTPHLHTKIKSDPHYNDPLLNDWGIHHLHLGAIIQPNGFVNRTGPVLFARITDDNFYLIDVMDHSNGNQPWAKQKLFEIIHSNWPESINHNILNGIEMNFHPSDKDRTKLRKGGVFIPTQLPDGTIYFPIGGGCATSGKSVEAFRQAHYYINLIRYIENHIKNNVLEIMSPYADINQRNTFEFHLIEIRDGVVSFFESQIHKIFTLTIQE